MVPVMNKVLANPKKPKHEVMITAAFGLRGIEHTDQIKAALIHANVGDYRVIAQHRLEDAVATMHHNPSEPMTIGGNCLLT
jgi:hypothetical protein